MTRHINHKYDVLPIGNLLPKSPSRLLTKLAMLAIAARFASMNQPTETGRARKSGIAWQAKLTIAIVCTALLASGIFYGLIRSYLHGDSFRRLLSQKASKALGTEGEFGAFRWDGLALESASFTANGSGPLRALQMDGLRTEVGLGGLKNGVWEITGSKVHRLETTLDFTQAKTEPSATKAELPSSTTAPSAAPTAPNTSASTPSRSWLPREVKFDGLQIADATINAKFGDKQLIASQLRADLKSFGRQGRAVDLSGGTLELVGKNFPPANIDRIRLKQQDDRLFLDQVKLSAWDNARLEASGELDGKSDRRSIDGSISGVKCSDLLSGDWVKRLSGELETTFSYNNHTGPTLASGKLVLKNGNLTAFPALNALATFSNTQRFRSLAFNDAHSDWQWQDGRLTLDNLVIASDGAIRAEGKITVDGENLDGQLNIGLPPEVLAKLPSAASDVFTVDERGMRWAPIRITGTTNKPKEDLSERLISAATTRILGKLQQDIPATGENALGTTEEIINSEKPVEKSVEAILNNSDSARKLLKGLLQKLPAKE
jgi:hypothetical protein